MILSSVLAMILGAITGYLVTDRYHILIINFPWIMEIMVETVIRIMKALNHYPRFVLRDVEPIDFKGLRKPAPSEEAISGAA